jgi:acyl-homoserine-lactone acylase
MSFRAQRSARLMAEDDSITFDELIQYKHSTRMELADRLLDELIPLAKSKGALLADAAAVLERWDRLAEADSRAPSCSIASRGWSAERGRPFSRRGRENRGTPELRRLVPAGAARRRPELRVERPPDVAWGVATGRRDGVDAGRTAVGVWHLPRRHPRR